MPLISRKLVSVFKFAISLNLVHHGTLFRGRLLFVAHISLLFLPLVHLTVATDNNKCAPSSCGKIHNISYPFRLRGDPSNCGNKSYELGCEQNNLTALYLYSGKYYMRAINYNNYTIRLVDAGIQENCSSLPRYSLTVSNFSDKDAFIWYKYQWGESDYLPKLAESMVFLNCANPVNSSSFYVDAAPCINGGNHSNSSFSRSGRYYYVVFGPTAASEVEDLCRVEVMALTSLPVKKGMNISYMEIYSRLVYGCGHCRSWEPCRVNSTDHLQCLPFATTVKEAYWVLMVLIIGAIITLKCCCGAPCVTVFLIYKWRKRHMSMYDRIENFLQSQNNFMPIRYSYSQIKKMTEGFKDKLGEGGYGSVFKGKLRSGHLVAVKMLGKSKANGQEFINEVATIGRIHHVNVVQLIGFCAEGTKRALVYEFMPNGSLDKYTFGREGNTTIGWEKIYEISLGVARGIEYLHRGCDMQILHFDIKPHNILLDENFTAKVSDFGLAKLYPTNDTTVTLTAARGTIGYIALELFYKNIGGVSYKADVYSFGMLLMEMAAKRRNSTTVTEQSSEAYFPCNNQ
ncbi:Protein kinase domain - like 10 [Theobroma cacao]|nr:Protein kinase domain - like 10 [Theobroma cacao]